MNMMKLAIRNAKQGAGKGIIITLILVTMLISGALNIAVCLQQTILRDVISQFGDAHAKFENLTKDQADFLRNRIEAEYAIYVIGIDEMGFLPGRDAFRIPLQSFDSIEQDTQTGLDIGKQPVEMNEIAIMPHTARAFGIEPKLGEKVTMRVGENPETAQPMEFEIAALFKEKPQFDAMGLHNIIVSEAYAESMYKGTDVYGKSAMGMPNNVRQVTMRYRPGIDAHEKTAELAELAGVTDERDYKTNDMYINATADSGNIANVIAGIVLLFVLVGALVVYNIFNMLLIKKVKQFGLLRVIGASKWQIMGCAYYEALIYNLIALPAGLILGALLSYIAGAGAFSGMLPNTEVVMVFSPGAFALGAVVSLLTTAVSVLLPALRVAKIAPVEAVRFSGLAEKHNRKRSYDFMDMARLSRINLWRNKGRTIVTIASLVLSGMMFIAVSNIAISQMNSADALAAQTAVGDMQINKGYTDEDHLNDDFIAEVEAIPGVTKVYPIYVMRYKSERAKNDPEYADQPMLDESIIGMNDEMLQRQIAAAGMPDDTFDRLKQPGAVLDYLWDDDAIAAWQPGVETIYTYRWSDDSGLIHIPGEINKIELITADNKQASAGVYGSSFASADMLRAFSDKTQCDALGIAVDPAQYDEVEAALTALCSDKPDLMFKTLKAAIEELRNQMLGVYGLLLAIVLVLGLVGFLNLANMTFVSIEQRKQELGVLRALGATMDDVKRMIVREGQLVSMICAAVSIGLGLVLGYLGVMGLRSIGADYMRYDFPWWQIALLSALMFGIPMWIANSAQKQLRNVSAVSMMQGVD